MAVREVRGAAIVMSIVHLEFGIGGVLELGTQRTCGSNATPGTRNLEEEHPGGRSMHSGHVARRNLP